MSAANPTPSGWHDVNLTDVGYFKSGSGFPLRVQGNKAGKYPFFKVSDFSNDGNERILLAANHYVDEDTRAAIGAGVIPSGAVVFARIGAAIFLERKRRIAQDSCIDNNMAAYIVTDPAVSPDLLLLNLQSFALGSLVSSTALPAISSTDLKGITFCIPKSLEEQNAIAQALSDIDDLLASLDALIAKKRDIEQGAMQELLTGKRRLPGFSGRWTSVPFRQALRVRHGKSQKQVEVEGGIYPILATGGEIGRCNAPLYDKPSVLIGRKGTIDRPQYIETPFWSVDTLFYTEIQRGFSPKFIYYAFQRIDWQGYNEASGVPSLNAKTIEDIEVALPEEPEQRAIVEVLDKMEGEIANAKAKRQKLALLRQGMMQQLLTGRVRLS